LEEPFGRVLLERDWFFILFKEIIYFMNVHRGFCERLTGFVLLTAALAACAPGQGRADATQTAIVNQKATDRAEMSRTLTAQPTATPTPTTPVGAALCRAEDLRASVAVQGATGSLAGSAVYTNVGRTTCVLQGPPDIRLVGADGAELTVRYQLMCMGCSPAALENATQEAAAQTAAVPLMTQAAQSILGGQLGLAPGQSASVFIVWGNWCETGTGPVSVRLVLPAGGGSLDAPMGEVAPRCDAPGFPSTLSISQYMRP
jgi:hypothetical protein